MSEPADNLPVPPNPRRLWIVGGVISLVIAALLGAMAWAYFDYYPSQIGPAQPIAFSHHFHVTTKGLSCVFCHPGAVDTERAGVPPLETCMLCHNQIITQHPEIVKLREAYYNRQPVRWVRVNQLPEFTYFNHQAHVRAGFDCSRCHGAVSEMDRMALVQDFQMGFCVNCHRQNKFSHDCYVCHR